MLCQLPATVLLLRRFIPVVTHFVKPKGEAQCRLELVQTIAELASIEDIQCMITLHVEAPYPNLLLVMDMLRKHSSMV